MSIFFFFVKYDLFQILIPAYCKTFENITYLAFLHKIAFLFLQFSGQVFMVVLYITLNMWMSITFGYSA